MILRSSEPAQHHGFSSLIFMITQTKKQRAHGENSTKSQEFIVELFDEFRSVGENNSNI
jgi:hypothetical protein